MFPKLFRLRFRKPRVVRVDVESPVSSSHTSRKRLTNVNKPSQTLLEKIHSMHDISEEAKRRILQEIEENNVQKRRKVSQASHHI